MSDGAPDPELSPAAEVFAHFLIAHDEGGGDIETHCRQHPQLQAQLRRLHADWLRLDQALGAAKDPNAAERYERRECLAQGGMGAVYRVHDRHLRRELAMKVLSRARAPGSGPGSSDPRSVSRFLDEARVTAQLQHPGIPPVHDLGLDADGQLFFTMPLVPGRTLKQIVDQLPQRDPEWPLARVLGVLLKVCEAVAFAHAQGVIHRDLKPGNVMVGQFGETYVMDWGLARVLSETSTAERTVVASERAALGSQDPGSPLVTRDGDVVGTPAYMPPEQARGDLASIGPRADVYAAGAMLYHLLAGVPPYGGGTASSTAVLAQVLAGPPPPLALRAPTAPPELVAICARAMAARCEDRYPDLGGVAADLRAYLEGRVVSAYEAGTWAQLKKLVARNRATAVAVAGAVVAMLVGLVTSRSEAQAAAAGNVLALAAIEKMLAEVGTKRLEDVPRAWPVRQALLEDAIALYEQVLARRSDDAPTRTQLARCWRDLGQVRSKLGDLDGAETALDRAAAAFAALAAERPEQVALRGSCADAAIVLAIVHDTRGDAVRAEQDLRSALAMLDGIGQETPELLELRANAHGQLGNLMVAGQRFAEALVELQQALALARTLQTLDPAPVRREGVARRVDQIGLTHARLKEHAKAEPCHAEAVAMLAVLRAQEPKDERFAASHACALGNLGLCKRRLGDRAGGEQLLQQSVATWREVIADHPEVPRYHSLLGTALVDLALGTSDADPALAHLDAAQAAYERAIAISPGSKAFRGELLFCHRQRLMKLCATRRHRDVVAGAAVLAAIDAKDEAQAMFAAQFVAHAIGYLGDDDSLTDAGRDALRASYADTLVAQLRSAVDRGCRTVARFEAAHFAPVREHPGYKALLAELRDAPGK